MKRYPHTTPWTPAIGLAALASVATLALAVVLPAVSAAPAAADASISGRTPQVTVVVERLDAAAAQPTASAASAHRG